MAIVAGWTDGAGRPAVDVLPVYGIFGAKSLAFDVPRACVRGWPDEACVVREVALAGALPYHSADGIR